MVIGQDEKDVGGTDSSQWWEEERSVEELLLHPDCDPDTAPQFCVVALVLSQQFSMNTSLQYRPRPACLTCLVEDINSKLLKGVPNLASYGLQSAAKAPKAGSYKGPDRLRDYVEESSKCLTRNITTRQEQYSKDLTFSDIVNVKLRVSS